MNATSPRSEKRRQVTPLAWASGGTVLLHGAFLLALLWWPHAPVKPRETLLEVDLKDQKIASTPQPTKSPLKVVKPPTQPRPQLKPRVVIAPKVEPRTRVAKAEVVQPLPTLVPLPTPIPTVEQPQAKAPVATPPPVKTATPPETVKTEVVPPPTKANTDNLKTTREAKRTKGTNSSSGSPSKSGGSPDVAPERPSAPSSGPAGRRLARNDAPKEDAKNWGRDAGAPSSADAGSNSGGRSEEAAGAEPGLDLPRSHSQRGRRGPSTDAAGSAPTASKEGTEVDLGPSAPTASTGRSRRAASGAGAGDDERGPERGGGLPNAEGLSTSGNAKIGRGADEAAGNGVSNGGRGAGASGNGKRGRGGSRLASDPFAAGNGNGGGGKGNGGSGGDGTGTGPKGGTRFATRGTGRGGGAGDGDGEGQFGRGTGLGTGAGEGNGEGKNGRGPSGIGVSQGSGGNDTIDDAGSGRSRSRRKGGGHRETEAEDQIGRGIWGGFSMRYYQDKSRYPDDVDTRTIQGKPIDWPVFTEPALRAKSPNLDFDWGTNPPIKGLKGTFWSLKADGRIFVPKDDVYEFFFDELDDAGKLILDGKTIISVWNVQKSTPSSEKIPLKRGAHDIQIQYVQGPATAASIRLSWKSTSFPKEIVGVYKAPE